MVHGPALHPHDARGAATGASFDGGRCVVCRVGVLIWVLAHACRNLCGDDGDSRLCALAWAWCIVPMGLDWRIERSRFDMYRW